MLHCQNISNDAATNVRIKQGDWFDCDVGIVGGHNAQRPKKFTRRELWPQNGHPQPPCSLPSSGQKNGSPNYKYIANDDAKLPTPDAFLSGAYKLMVGSKRATSGRLTRHVTPSTWRRSCLLLAKQSETPIIGCLSALPFFVF